MVLGITLMMEAASTSEMSVNFDLTTQRNIPEDSHLGLSPCSQEPATSPHPEPNKSSPHPPTYFHKIHFHIIVPSTPMSSE
jgi:hypothetical protein